MKLLLLLLTLLAPMAEGSEDRTPRDFVDRLAYIRMDEAFAASSSDVFDLAEFYPTVSADELFPLEIKGKFGIISSVGVLLEPRYSFVYITSLPSGDAIYYAEYSGGSNVFYLDGTRVFPEVEIVIMEERNYKAKEWYETSYFIYAEEDGGKRGVLSADVKRGGEAVFLTEAIYDGIEKDYENELLKVEKDGKRGILDMKENAVTECVFDKIEKIFYKNGQPLYIFNNGSFLTADGRPAASIASAYAAFSFGESFVIKDRAGKYAILDKNFQLIELPCDFPLLNGSEPVMRAGLLVGYNLSEDESERYYGLIGQNGEIAKAFEKSDPQPYSAPTFDKDGFAIAELFGFYGVVSRDGEVKIPPIYEKIIKSEGCYSCQSLTRFFIYGASDFKPIFPYFADSLRSEAGFNIVGYKGGERAYTADFSREITREAYDEIRIGEFGLFAARRGEKWGLLDFNGRLLADFVYDEMAAPSKYGTIAVLADDLTGILARDGSVLLEPSVECFFGKDTTFMGTLLYIDNGVMSRFSDISEQ